MTTEAQAASMEATLALCPRDQDIRILSRVVPLEEFPLMPRGNGAIAPDAAAPTIVQFR